jgi:Family of unknown function (DUF5681)
MAFTKGQSGNPGGRPKGSKTLELLELLAKKGKKDKTDYVAEYLDFLIDNYKEDSRLMVWMGDHIFGKAPQSLDLTSDGEKLATMPLTTLSNEQLEQIAAGRAGRVGTKGTGTAKS